MGLLIEGMNKARDLIAAALTQGQCGTGTSTATSEDTGLDEAQGGTLKTLTVNTADRLITVTFSLNSAEGNGLSLTEFENAFSTGESLCRIRHTPISKSSTNELTFIVQYGIEGA